MKEIKRDFYLNKLLSRKNSDFIKVITGIRRCGKSYLLFNLYYNYLLANGTDKEHIISINLESDENEYLYDRTALREFIKSKIIDKKQYYLFLDEVQYVENFEPMLNGLNQIKNLDIYVTGSNSKFLSSDIITEFRGRTEEIRVFPLSFREFSSAYEEKNNDSLTEYLLYGGMPYTLSFNNNEEKSNYLKNLFKETFLKDIIDRNNIRKDEILESLVNILSSSVGSLTNSKKIVDTFISKGYKEISDKTIATYINYLLNSFIINKAERYDVKGRKYISTPSKYYFSDLGLRNARLNFRQYEESHLMENT
ncbi:MAG: ATP-binding protein, partial [Elusimicrobia bacterium]|nr:ATP-binding protein [Elusimicrobiota bacterium]